jgi:hypothetical protein
VCERECQSGLPPSGDTAAALCRRRCRIVGYAAPRQCPPAAAGRDSEFDISQTRSTYTLRDQAASWLTSPLHPVLFAAYPILFLFAQNLREQLSLEPLVVPLAASVGGTVVVLIVLRLAVRDWLRAALICSLLVAVFFGYGHVWNAVADTVRLHRYLLAVSGLLLLVGLVVAWRMRPGQLRTVTGVANVASFALVALNLVPILGFQLHGVVAASSATSSQPAASAVIPGRRPDIYYLIFDRYGAADTLERIYGLDNSAFLDELERRGFYVARDSAANYVKTALSLASSLNMDYLDLAALESQAQSADDWTPIYRMLSGAEAVQTFLKTRGYVYVHLGSPFSFTATNSAADLNVRRTEQSEFVDVLLDTTIIRAASSFLPDETADRVKRFWLFTRYQLDRLEDVTRQPGPKFVFAHVTLPHPPYVFDRDGNFVPEPEEKERGRQRGFREQVEYANARILALLDILLTGPEEERPIVIIQADEGPYPIRSYSDGFDWPAASAPELAEKYRILNAYYLPGVEGSELYPSISPVNSFRVVFNAYFDANLPLLPDRSYVFTDSKHIYTAVDITDKVRGAGSP